MMWTKPPVFHLSLQEDNALGRSPGSECPWPHQGAPSKAVGGIQGARLLSTSTGSGHGTLRAGQAASAQTRLWSFRAREAEALLLWFAHPGHRVALSRNWPCTSGQKGLQGMGRAMRSRHGKHHDGLVGMKTTCFSKHKERQGERSWLSTKAPSCPSLFQAARKSPQKPWGSQRSGAEKHHGAFLYLVTPAFCHSRSQHQEHHPLAALHRDTPHPRPRA